MAFIKPFRATRPAKDKVAMVASRSYEEYSQEELESRLRLNPFSFLHIINPGFMFDKKVSGEERFRMVHDKYLEFLKEEVLQKDPTDSFYLYKIEKKNFSCCGLFCATSIADYKEEVIKRHEETIERREKLFAHYLQIVKFEAEPVLMTYPENGQISNIIREEIKNEPEYEFTTPDGITHSLWRVYKSKTITGLQEAFKKIDSLYIADGHHRSASSNLLAKISRQNNPNHTGKEAYNYFLSYLIPEEEIKIFEFNRMVKDLNGLSKESFLMLLEKNYSIKNFGNELYRPDQKHHFSMYLDGDFYSLALKQNIVAFTDPLSKLDTQILFKTILEPILGISDLRNDKRIQYGYGKRNVVKMKEEIDKMNFEVGFGLVPITMTEIKAIADAGLVMPPKSTYIEPKLRSALTIYDL